MPRIFRPHQNQAADWPPVVIYSRSGCHLCDDAVSVVQAVLATRAVTAQIIDIDADDDLSEQFTHRVPVIVVGEKIVAEYVITERVLRAALERGGAS